jgi:uroporphyrinogen III methyltransferase/synthase
MNGSAADPDTRPLEGRRILVTRASEQAGALTSKLKSAGAIAIDAPAIKLQDPPDWSPCNRAIEQLAEYRWILFTSQNTLPRLLARMQTRGLGIDALRSAGLVAVGEATARGLREAGLTVENVPDEYRAEGVLELLARSELEGVRILLPRALVAREELPEGLRARGAIVDVAPVYETVADPAGAEIARREMARGVDAVTFTSASTATHFLQALGADGDSSALDPLRQICLASIGPITSARLRRLGLEPSVEADPFTVEALVEALAGYFEKRAEEKQ